MHFCHESSVVKTTGNLNYGQSTARTPAIEVQRFASNATFTVNLLHGISGIEHINILNIPSNGLELLNFFGEAIKTGDIFGNRILTPGDTVGG